MSPMDTQEQAEDQRSERLLVHTISLDKQPAKPALKSEDHAERTPKSHHRVAFGGDEAEIAEHDPDSVAAARHAEQQAPLTRRQSIEEIRRKSMDVPVRVVVTTFYGKISQHPRLAAFFSDIDMPSLIRKQEAMMVYAFGGPELAKQMGSAADIRAIHEKLIRDKGVTLDDFDEFIRLFADTLTELEIPDETRRHAVETLTAFRGHFAL